MKIEKMASGKYRIRQQYKGKRYCITLDHKPKQDEARALMDEVIGKRHVTDMTFLEASQNYIASRENILSPSTIAGYESILRRIPEYFTREKIADINQQMIQTYVNESSVTHSPKTVHNEHGFISAVLTYFYPEMRITTRLPQNRPNEPHIPSDDDIKKVLDCLPEKYHIPFKLSVYGLRRSEICALTMDDIHGNQVKITKAIVQDKHNNWIVKDIPKTSDSYRTVFVDSKLADEINEKGLPELNPSQLSNGINHAVKKSKVPHFSLHKMRHYFASYASAMQIPEADILKMGGWRTDHVMKSHYRHSLKHKESAEKYADQMGGLFD